MESVLGPEIWIAMGITLLSGVIRGFSGFGSAMAQAPVFAILFSAPQAVATMAGLGLLASIQLQAGVWRETAWREVIPISAAAALTIPLGVAVLRLLEPELMRRGISALVLVMVVILMTGWRYPGRPGPWAALAAGGISGLINGSTGVGGPPVVLYLLAGPNPAHTNRANLITYYIFLNGLTFITLLIGGVVTWQTFARTALLFPTQLVSLFAGAWLFRRAPDAIYRRIAMGLLLAIAGFGLFYS